MFLASKFLLYFVRYHTLSCYLYTQLEDSLSTSLDSDFLFLIPYILDLFSFPFLFSLFVVLDQSRVGPVQWLKPYTDEVLVELGQKGVKSLLTVPVRYGLNV